MSRRSYPVAKSPSVAAVDSPDGLIRRLQRLELSAYWRTFREESLAFKLACIYLMFEYVRPQSIWTVIDILPFGLLTLVGGVVAVLAAPAKGKPRIYGSQLGLLLVFLSVVLVSILASAYPSTGLQNLTLLVAWICAYFLITRSVSSRQGLIFFYVLFLLFSFKMSQHGFKSWAFSGFGFNREGVTGAPGWFQNSGEVGIQMCIFLPMMLHFMFAGWAEWNWGKRLAVSVVPLTIIGTVVGSSSRGALIGSAVALLWMLARSKHKFRGLIAVAVIGVVVALVLPPEFYERLTIMGEDNSSTSRLDFWKFGWEMMKQHPALGIGYFNWVPVYADYLLSIGDRRQAMVCHNIFIQAGSELGFTGLAIVLAFIVRTFILNARTRRILDTTRPEHANFYRHLSLGLDAGMIGFLVSAQFVTVLYYPYLWIAMALTTALHTIVQPPSKPSVVRNTVRPSPRRGVLTTSGVS